ncbi:NAD(P)/FAD-dependent oxidoreductase [Sulfurimonas marina]|uniref:NAD(P)/FAD-dependent oxidoreductase n=1 Tax=Sulfurimonas marina TaxID=2590551 RepID=A0A7M1AVZ9_9BACT|nr:NAD(P)/FAD-dependent oxidoreductase [Sulfurimonas marina]QOP41627.1 NAD(P)/FAD-dependent oxidoreductase [Sulfurimonas marina]
MKIAIIGAGASGLFCAIECAKNGVAVDLYEQNTKPAKKILVSGNGRCNISNNSLNSTDFFSQNPTFVEYALKNFGFEHFEKSVNSLGLLLNVLEDGRAYPLSNEAKSVANTFIQTAQNLGVKIITDTKIDSLLKLKENYDAVVVATGSEAASHLGGCSDGYKFAEELGHKIIPTYPSLVQLELNSNLAKKMAGAKVDGEVSLYINGMKENTIAGDILFTNYGVSGFAILDISQMASESLLNYQAVDIAVNLLPNFNAQKLSNHIQKVAKTNSELTIFDILLGLLPTKIVNGVLESLHIVPQTTTLDTKLSKKIANQILNWKFEVSDTHGFRHAEVSGGGVDTSEIDEKTFQSKKENNIYFIGEVLDVVGRRGGYNFAFAWSSAYTASQHIIKNKI